ncbi:MAG: RNA polymerase sigma factor (TIGR02999 family) [Francisellaceae bacterium]|jgi:RNA polymerase sigma factor (TIGR02999 family)
MNSDSSNENFTVILNTWITYNDLTSANQLKSMVYYHLKGIVKNQIANKSKRTNSTKLLEQLPNTTSLLHDVFVQLVPPQEIFDNREQFYVSLALFVRWMLLDELKAKNAQKRCFNNEKVTDLLSFPDDNEPYFIFDEALSKLEKLSPRCYKIALLHYYLGYEITEIKTELNIKKSTVYNELSTAKAYLRTQYQAA